MKLGLKVLPGFIFVLLFGKHVFCQDPLDSIYKTFFPKVIALPSIINSNLWEYNPVFDYKRQLLYFTQQQIPKQNIYTEFIWLSKKTDNGWCAPNKMKIPKNDGNKAVCGISKSDDVLYIYSGAGGGNIYYSKNKDSVWTHPFELDNNISSNNFQETTLTISSKEDVVFFVRRDLNKKNSGDVFLITKIENRWGKAVRLDSSINSDMDEEGVYIDSTGKYFFFSSKGHNSLGGFDIFVSEIKDGKFSQPVNLGYPINTIYDDVFFSISNDLKTAYYSSNRDKEDHDIYEVDFETFNFLKLINWKKTIAEIDSTIEMNGENRLLFVRGIYKINSGDFYGGFTDLLKYKQGCSDSNGFANPFCTDTDLLSYFEKYGQSQYLNMDYPSAIISFSNLLILRPNDTTYLYNRGMAFFFNKDIISACDDMGAASSLGSNNAKLFINKFLKDVNAASAYNKRAVQRFKEEKYNLAISDIDKVIEILPKSISALKIRAEIKLKIGDKGGACNDWKTCIELGDISLETQIHDNCN